jgi:hypothetical protein
LIQHFTSVTVIRGLPEAAEGSAVAELDMAGAGAVAEMAVGACADLDANRAKSADNRGPQRTDEPNNRDDYRSIGR